MSAVAQAQVSPAHDLVAGLVPSRVTAERRLMPAEPRRSTEATNATLRALSERAQAVELLETGVEATAVVVGVRPTGTTCNGVPVVALSLAVDVPDGPPRVVVRHVVVPLDDHPADGSRPRVAVLVDPSRPENVLLRFDLRPLA